MNKETARAAYDLLAAGPHRWTKDALARDSENYEVDPLDPRATCFCLLGAFVKITGIHPGADRVPFEPFKDLFSGLHLFGSPTQLFELAIFNDTHTYEEVLELLLRIENALPS